MPWEFIRQKVAGAARQKQEEEAEQRREIFGGAAGHITAMRAHLNEARSYGNARENSTEHSEAATGRVKQRK